MPKSRKPIPIPNPGHVPFLSRYRSMNVPVFAVGVTVYGALMLAASDAQYRAKVYELIFALAPREVWGVVFMVVGAAVLLHVRVWTTIALAALLTTWAALIFVSMITSFGDVPPASPVLPCTMAIALLISVAHRGIRPPRTT